MVLNLNNQYYLDTHQKFIDCGWKSSQSPSKVLFTFPGKQYKVFAIKHEKNKTVVTIPILKSDIQYDTVVSDMNEACDFLQTHLTYYTQNEIKQLE